MELKLPAGMTAKEFEDILNNDPESLQDIVDSQFEAEERPDQILLRRTLESLEEKIGEFDFVKDEGFFNPNWKVWFGDQSVELDRYETAFQILDKDRGENDMEWMFDTFFEPAAQSFADTIRREGLNVCRPMGIQDNDLTAKDGTLQLYKDGEKVSIYMAHRYHKTDEPYTEVKLQLLLGKQ